MLLDVQAHRPLILIVDDNPDNLHLLGKILQEEFDDVAAATSGQEALDFVEKEQPHLILLDIMMPEMDGYETCRRLKANPKSADIPVIFLTAKTETADLVKGFSLGAVDYVTKPFNGQELLARVNTHLDLHYTRNIIEEISAKRREMVHVLVHDLANPLIAIRGLLEISETPEALANMRPYLQQAANNGLDIIDLVRKLQTAEMRQLKLEPVDVGAALDQSLSILRLKIDNKQLKIVKPEANGIMVMAEPVSLSNTVLNNLLTNAIKFSYPGKRITISIRQNEHEVFLKIRDEGIGMPAELTRDLFNLQRTVSRPGTAGEAGTGFGMPLVKNMMRAYKGDISVTSREETKESEDHGTEVTLAFQKAKAE